ncbi:MAG: response regulator [Polyangiaceae bacterium]
MTTPLPVVVVIEDDPHMALFLRTTLGATGYRVVDAETGTLGLALVRSHNPEIVLLDLGLPDMDGLDVMRDLRTWSTVPVVVLSARGQEEDKVAALDAGADDYLTKPFGSGELAARMRVALRHASRGVPPADEAFGFGDVRVDVARRLVFRSGEEVHLSPIEYRLLAFLVRHPDRVLTHRQILKDVWGPSHVHETQYLRVYMGQLRQKLEEVAARPRYLVTEPGVGYRLKTDPE